MKCVIGYREQIRAVLGGQMILVFGVGNFLTARVCDVMMCDWKGLRDGVQVLLNQW